MDCKLQDWVKVTYARRFLSSKMNCVLLGIEESIFKIPYNSNIYLLFFDLNEIDMLGPDSNNIMNGGSSALEDDAIFCISDISTSGCIRLI